MRRYLLVSMVLCLLGAGCHRGASVPKPAADLTQSKGEAQAGPLEDFVIGEPLRHGNLTIFPVLSKQPKLEDRYLTLDDGIKAGTVEIMELGAVPGQAAAPSADDPFGDPSARVEEDSKNDNLATPAAQDPFGGDEVNRLMIVNKSNRPLYLMPGEIIVGGSQDRTIAKELVIQPDKKPVPIDVFCVEHGRWGLRERRETTELLTAAQAIDVGANSVAIDLNAAGAEAAVKAEQGKFVASLGSLSKGARLAVQGAANQGEVWNQVAKENAASGVQAQTSAFTTNYVDGEMLKRLAPYLNALQEPVATRQQVVGVIVAINGKPDTLDVFETTPLFRRLWPKLLKSYALDAVQLKDEEDADLECPRMQAQEFLADAAGSRVDASDVHGGLALKKRSSERIDAFSAEDRGAMGGMGGFGGVHVSGFAK